MRVLSAALAFAALATSAGAQVVHTRPAGAAAAGAAGAAPRAAAIAPAPQPVIVAPGQTVYVPPGMALYGNVPVVLLPDGRVYADFGRGYEQILRNCANVISSYTVVQPAPTVQPTVTQPVVTQPSAAQQPLPYTPPVPNQQTASQQMLPPTQSAQVVASQSTLVNTQACWIGNGYGQVFVAR